MKKTILCIEDEAITTEETGLLQTKWEGLVDLLGDQIWAVPRVLAEDDPTFRQIIPYLTLVTEDGKVLAYQRGKAGTEGRLHDLWSIGIGGHCEIGDLTEEDVTEEVEDPWGFVIEAANRELVEELPMAWIDEELLILGGVIRLEDSEVDSVHLGIWLIALISNEDAEGIFEDAELALKNPQWFDIEELASLQLENWSALALENISAQLAEVDGFEGCGPAGPKGCHDQHCCDDDGA